MVVVEEVSSMRVGVEVRGSESKVQVEGRVTVGRVVGSPQSSSSLQTRSSTVVRVVPDVTPGEV